MANAEEVRTDRPVRNWLLFLRGLAMFLVFALGAMLLYWFCLHHFSNVAVWAGTAEVREAVVYEDQTFHLASKVGDYGLSASKYAQGELLGEVKPAGKEARTAAVKVYSVKGSDGFVKSDYLMVIYEDGVKYIYYLDGVENPYLGEEPEDEDWWAE
jgi:hypothetical protein